MEDKLNIAYKALSDKYNVGSIDDFKIAMQDDNKSKKAYEALSQSYNVGDYETFISNIRPQEESKDSYFGDLGERAISGLAGVPASSLNLLGKIANKVGDIKDSAIEGVSNLGGLVGIDIDSEKAKASVNSVIGGTPLGAIANYAVDNSDKIKSGSEYFKGVQENWQNKSDRYKGKDFMQLAKEGKYGDALGEVFLSATQSLPQSLIIAGTGGAGLIGTGITTASDKHDQLSQENPDMNKYAKIGNAIVTGASEALTEVFGAGTLGRVVKNALETGGKRAAAKVIEKNFLDKLADISTKYYAAPVLEEGLEETTNAFVEYAVDTLTGVKRDDSLGEAMLKAGVYGAAGGMQYTPVTAGAHYYTEKSKKRITNTYNETKPLAESILGDKLGDFDAAMDRMDERQKGQFIDNVSTAYGLNKEQKESLLNYSGARISYGNYIQNVEKEITEEQTKAAEEIKANTNKDMGASVILNGGGEEFNVTGGNIVTNADGTINYENSDETVYVKGPDGKVTPRLSKEFDSVLSITPLEQLYAERMAMVKQSVIEQEDADIYGRVDDITPQSFNIGEQVGNLTIQDVTPEGNYIAVDNTGLTEEYTPQDLAAIQVPAENAPEATNIVQPEAVPEVQQPAEEVAQQVQYPLDKEGNVDYNAIQDPEMYASALQEEFGEESVSVINEMLEAKAKELEKAQKNSDSIKKRRLSAKINAEVDRLNGIKTILSPINVSEKVEQSEVVPSEEQSNLSESLPQTHEEYIQGIIENGSDPTEIADAYRKEMEAAGYETLLPWQQQLIGRKINKDSFLRYGDKNKMSGAIGRSWINPKSEETSSSTVDAIAEEISEYGTPVTPEDIIQFIYDHPSNRINKGNEITKGLNESFRRSVKELTGQDVGGVDSNSAKLVMAGIAAGKRTAEEQALLPFQGATIPDAMVNFFEASERLPEDFETFEDFNNFVEQELQNGLFDFPLSENDYAQIKILINNGIEQSRNWEDYAGRTEKARNSRAAEPTVFEDLAKEQTGNELGGLFGERREDTEGVEDTSVNTEEDPQPIGKMHDWPLTAYEKKEKSVSASSSDIETEPNGKENGTATSQNGLSDNKATAQNDNTKTNSVKNESPIDLISRIAEEETAKQAIKSAEQEVNVNPTDAQKEAGNYKKGHLSLNGFDITIEQPKGSTRSGVDQDGKEWSIEMQNTYGYFKNTKGVDGDHIDVFIGDNPTSQKVFVVDQINKDGSFDEHKVLFGFDTLEDAKSGYLSNYEDGWQGLGSITEVSMEDFKKWIDSSTRKTKPFLEYKSIQNPQHDILFRDGETSEESEIISNAKANETYLKAPNGEKTNLSPKQWVQVRTKAFKEWFGDWENDAESSSKIVDDNGEPLVVFHGTKNNFTVFEEGYDNARGELPAQGFWFTNNESVAEEYSEGGEVVNSFINSRNIKEYSSKYDLMDIIDESFVDDMKNYSSNLYAEDEEDAKEQISKLITEDGYLHSGEGTQDELELYSFIQNTIYNRAKEDGFDAIKINDISRGDKYISFVVINPNQIKSATDNNGEFSKDNDDIRFRDGEVNARFNDELQQQIDGTLPKGHIYQLGNPSDILQSAGIPNLPIELSASQLEYKATSGKHDYDLNEVMDLPNAISNPIATFKYGDKNKSQNILTVLDHNGENFLVGLFIKPTVKGKVLEINSIRNVFPKNSDGIVNWINDDKLTFANKEKLLEFLDQQRTNHADVAFVLPDEQVKQENQEAVSSATNIVNDFVNPTLNDGKIMSAAEDLTNTLGGGVRIIRDVNEITDDDKSTEKRKRASKGWFDPKTGEVVIVLPNNTSIADVQATVLHEMVAHKGLRGLLGDKFDEMMDSIYKNLPDSVKETVTRAAVTKYNLDTRIATEEYLASIAEKGVDKPETWNRIKSAIKEVFRTVGIDLKMTDEDIAYLLWKSKNRLEKGDSPSKMISKAAKDADMRDLLYRDPDKDGYMDLDAEGRRSIYDTIDRVKEAYSGKKLSIKKGFKKFLEAYVDGMRSLKKFQEAVEKKSGEKIKDFENAYIDQNSSLSRSTNEVDEFENGIFSDLVDEIINLMNVRRKTIKEKLFGSKKYKDEISKSKEKVTNYMMAKHGLERNAKMREDELQELRDKLDEKLKEHEALLYEDLEGKKHSGKYSEKEIARQEKTIEGIIKKRQENNEEEIDKKRAKLKSVDYSGLTALSKELFDSDTMDEDMIRDYVEEYEAENDTSKLWELTKKATGASLTKMYVSGCISKEIYDETVGMYENYIPLREWAEQTAGDVYEYYFKEEKDIINTPMKTAKGRESKAGDILANIYSMNESSVFVGNKNRTKLKFLNMVRNHLIKNGLGDAVVSKQVFINKGTKELPEWEAALPEGLTDDMERNREILDEFDEKMKELQKEGKAKVSRDFLRLGMPIKKWQSDQHAIQLKENGEDIVIYINGDPSVAQAINGLNKIELNNKVIKAADSIKRFISANYTSRHVDFVARNISRDSWFVNNMNIIDKGWKYEGQFLMNYKKASGAIIRGMLGKIGDTEEKREFDKLFKEFKQHGGRTGFVSLEGYNRVKDRLERKFAKLNGKKLNSLQMFNLVAGYIETMNSFAEDLNRFNVYVTSRKTGQSITQSVNDAKESSVNFNRKGSGAYGARYFNSLFFFFNAGVQGQYRYWSASKRAPVQMALYFMLPWFVKGFMLKTILSSLVGDDDDDWYNNLPDYVRQNNICLKLPWIEKVITIPLSIEQRIFYGLGDMTAQVMDGDYKGRNFSADVASKLMDFLPINMLGDRTQDKDYFTVGNVARNFIPDAVAPFADAYLYNQDFFGKRITARGQYNENKPEYRKATKGTSSIAVKMSEMINAATGGDYATKGWADSELLNPSAVEYIMEQYLGGVGKMMTKTYKSMESVLNGEIPEGKNIPVVGGMSYDTDGFMPNTVVNERYKGYEDLAILIQDREKMYIDGLYKGEANIDNYVNMFKDKDYKIASIVDKFKPQIDNLSTLVWTMDENTVFMDKKAKEAYEKTRKEIFSKIYETKKIMLNEIDKLK